MSLSQQLPSAFPDTPLADKLLYAPRLTLPGSLEQLDQSLAWRQDAIKIFGRDVLLPRLTAWYGEVDAIYRYSGITNQPLPWTPLLLAIKTHVEDLCGHQFNSVLANRYAHGLQHQGYHADDERELGHEPLIASLSFGATRRFLIKARNGKASAADRWALDLENRSLLVMRGDFQTCYMHALAKTQKPVGLRINLTFRAVKNY